LFPFHQNNRRIRSGGVNKVFRFLLKRFGYIIVSLFFIVTITFFMMQAAPGGPFASERKLPQKIEEQMNEAYGLNDPVYVQYFDYLKNAAQGDFGPSY